MPKENKPYTLRRFFNDIHLWLGVASGLVLFVVCLSGTIYTFRHEAEHFFESEKYVIESATAEERVDIDRIVEHLSDSLGVVSFISINEDPNASVEINIKTSAKDRRGTTFFVNPYTGTVLGKSGGSIASFFGTMMRLHRWLLMGDVGKGIVGVSTIIFVILIISGLVIWFPKKIKNWKQGLKIKWSGNWKRINHDLHNSLGFYSSMLLLVMALTGLCWSFGWYRTALGNVIGTKVFNRGGGEKIEVAVPSDSSFVSISKVLTIAQQEFDEPSDFRLSYGRSATDPLRITRKNTGFFAFSGADQMLLNPYSAEVISVSRFSEKAFNEKIASSIKPLHTGEIFGMFSKILYFVSCLIATSLPVTGVIIWINKLKKKAARKKKSKDKKIKLVVQ